MANTLVVPLNRSDFITDETMKSGVYYVVDLLCLVLQFLLIFPIVLGNCLVMRAIHQFERLKTPTSVFLGSLALSDLLVGIVTTPVFALIHNAHLSLERQRVSCVLSYNLAHCPVGVSMVTLLAIAVERFVAIHLPFFYRRHFTMGAAAVCAALIWMYVWVLIPALSFSTDRWASEMNECNFGSVLSKVYIIVLLMHMLVILVVTTALYLTIARTAHKHHVAISAQHVPATPPNQLTTPSVSFSHNAKLAKMLATVLGVFYLSWVPYFVSLPFAMTVEGHDPLWLHCLEQFAGIVVRCNAFMNPIVYAWKNQDFSQAFSKILHGRLNDGAISGCELDNYGSCNLASKAARSSQGQISLHQVNNIDS